MNGTEEDVTDSGMCPSGGDRAATAALRGQRQLQLESSNAVIGLVQQQGPLYVGVDQGGGSGREEAEKQEETGPSEIPAAYLCPITMDAMADPVAAADGFVYERSAIQAWLQQRSSSPLTNLPLPSKQLEPDPYLRGAIQEWLRRNPRQPLPLPREARGPGATTAAGARSSHGVHGTPKPALETTTALHRAQQRPASLAARLAARVRAALSLPLRAFHARRPPKGLRGTALVQHLRRQVEAAEARHGGGHRATQTLYCQLGKALYNNGDVLGTRAVAEKAVAASGALLKLDQARGMRTAARMAALANVCNLACVLCEMGEAAAAVLLLRKALAEREAVLGRDHYATLTTASNLASALIADKHAASALQRTGGCMRRWAPPPEALQLFRRVHGVRARRLGAQHPDTLFTAVNLASMLLKADAVSQPTCRAALRAGQGVDAGRRDSGRHAASRVGEGFALLRSVLECVERKGWPSELAVTGARALNFTVAALLATRVWPPAPTGGPSRRAEAARLTMWPPAKIEALYRRALAAVEAAMGGSHPALAEALRVYGAFLARRPGREGEGRALQQRARAMCKFAGVCGT